MTVARVWNGSAWEVIAGGVSQAQFDTIGARITALESKRLLDVQRMLGQNNAYRAQNGGSFFVDAAATLPLRLLYTPPVNAWWDVRLFIGLMQKIDAAYSYAQVTLGISPADADGDTGSTHTITQHAAVQTYEGYNGSALVKLSAGVAYQAIATFGVSGGSWQYHQMGNVLRIESKAWAR